MSDCEGSAAESEGFLLAFVGLAPDRPVFERGFGDDGDAVVLAVTELGSSQVAASVPPPRSLLGCVCADECHG